MATRSKTFGFRTLGPFYVTSQMFGLLLAREIDNKVYCSRTGGSVVFSPDRRFVAYNAFVLLSFYAALRRCVTLVGAWPCDDDAAAAAADCPSAVEWIVTGAGAVQAMAYVAVATVHRQSSTVGLLNGAYDVLARRRRGGRTDGGKRSHVNAAVTYAAAVMAFVLIRSAAVAAARPDRFAAIDVLLVCVPVAAVPIVVECAIVCVCTVAEDACRDVVDRLGRLNAAMTVAADGPAPRAAAAAADWHWRLETVWRDYWRGCRLVDRLSECYGLDLAVDLTANMLFFVVYAYVTMMSVYASCTGTVSASGVAAPFHWNVALACQLACVSFRIVFISYRAEKIKQVGENLVLISLRNLLKNNNLDNSTVMLINSFTYQITNRELKVSACGFFSVNLSFFHALLRLATTYLIIIIQYNSKPLAIAPSKSVQE